MPVLESTDKLAPKSILRHRPIGKDANASVTTTPIVQRASRPADVDNEIVEWKRKPEPTDTRQTQAQTGKRNTTSTAPKKLPRPPKPKVTEAEKFATTRVHPLLYLGLGMVAMLLLWTLLSTIFGWFSIMLDDIHYGHPRTFQTDAWVGHNEQTGVPSHFIAINLNRHIEIIEISGGDAAHTHIYTGPQFYGANDDLTPVTLKFVDVNGDHKLDMLVSFHYIGWFSNVNRSVTVFINDGNTFRPPTPSEQPAIERIVQKYSQ